MLDFTSNVSDFIGSFDEELVYNYEVDEPEEPPPDHEDEDKEEHPLVPDSGINYDPIINTQVILPRGQT